MHAQIGTTHSSLHIVAQVTDTPGSFPTDLILVFCLFPCPLPAPTPQVLLPKEISPVSLLVGFPCGSAGKQSACNAGDLGLIPGLGSIPWRREGLPTPIFWPGEFHGCRVHGVTKSQTRLSNIHFFTFMHKIWPLFLRKWP